MGSLSQYYFLLRVTFSIPFKSETIVLQIPCHLPPQLTQCELDGGELLAKLIVQLLLKIGWTHIVNDRGHVRGEGKQRAMLSGNQLRIVQNASGVLRITQDITLVSKDIHS